MIDRNLSPHTKVRLAPGVLLFIATGCISGNCILGARVQLCLQLLTLLLLRVPVSLLEKMCEIVYVC